MGQLNCKAALLTSTCLLESRIGFVKVFYCETFKLSRLFIFKHEN